MNQTDLTAPSLNFNKWAHPWLFFFFYMPFGIFSGYLNVTLAFQFSHSGISLQQIAGLTVINFVPQIFKFTWAPLVDTTLSLKKWYLLATLITAATIFATGIVPIKSANLVLFTGMILISSFARSFISAAIGGKAAHGTSPALKGRVGGWCQAGNLGGGAIGGGAGLWLAEHTVYRWVPGSVLTLVCLLCCIGLLYIQEPVSTIRVKSAVKTMKNLLNDVKQTLKTNRGLSASILNLLPLGTGAAGFLFAALAKDWDAGADMVAWVTGGLGGCAIIAGCVVGGVICDRVDRQKAFIGFSLLQGACCVAMAFCPHIPVMYIIWTLTYSLVNGFVNAGYSSFTLEATGRGAAASKFELYSSMSYLPTYLMVWISGTSYTKWHATGMLNAEAVVAVIAVGLFICAKIWMKNRVPVQVAADAVYVDA